MLGGLLGTVVDELAVPVVALSLGAEVVDTIGQSATELASAVLGPTPHTGLSL